MKLSNISLAICSAMLSVANAQANDALFKELDLNTGNTCVMELEAAQAKLTALRERVVPLKERLDSCKSKLDQAQQPNPELERLRAENRRLSGLAKKNKETSGNYASLALSFTELKGQKDVLAKELQETKSKNEALTQQVGSLQAQLAQANTNTTSVAITTPAVAKPVVTPAPKPKAFQASNGKIVGKLLSARRETNVSKNTDQLVIGLSLTNTTNKPIYGVLVGPEITAIDGANNMFANKDIRRIKGITYCQSRYKLYNTMNWCETQINQKKISTTSFRPGVPVNVLVTTPAINADPEKKSDKVNTTLFLLLEGEEKGAFEKYPVDIR